MYQWNQYTIYDTDDGDSIFDYIEDVLSDAEPEAVQIGARDYWKECSGYDIETTRISDYAFMYHWQWSMGKRVFLGRTWKQYETWCEALQKYLKRYKLRLLVWVANLGHEFAFLQYRHKWSSVFAKTATKPLKAATGKIEFRECLTISGAGGLENLAKNYCTTKKQKNDLDYAKIRNHYSKLNKIEKGYCIADVAILSEWAAYMYTTYIHEPGDKMPMTQTGICRKAVDDAARATGSYAQIKEAVKNLYPKKKEQYDYLMYHLFRGGFTHANAYWASSDDVNEIVPNVIGFDYTSSYPAVMLQSAYKYPVARFVPIELEHDGKQITDSRLNLDKNALIITIRFRGLKPRSMHTIESDHKIINAKGFAPEGVYLDNGRVICAESMTVCLTELDYIIYTWFYKWESIEIINCQCAPKGNLPKYLTKPLLAAYVKKCQLKAADMDHTPEYQNAKAIVNSFYGMCVQRLVFVDWYFDPEDHKRPWHDRVSKVPYWRQIQDKLLSPYWGIWVTAWARYKLLSVVHQLDPDKSYFNVVYCDTDSIYMIDTPRGRQIIKEHNAEIAKYNAELPQECRGKKNGKGALGCFDPIDNGVHYRFKTLGAKRYIKLANGVAEIVVAGMRKGSYEHAFASETPPDDDYIIVRVPDPDDKNRKKEMYMSEYDLFAHFRDGLMLDINVSDKLCSKYTFEPYSADVGGVCMQELSGVALVPTTFNIKMSDYYKALVKQIKAEERHNFEFEELEDTIELDETGSLVFIGSDEYE